MAMLVRSSVWCIGGDLNKEVGVIILSRADRGLLSVNSARPAPERNKLGVLNVEPILRTVVKFGDDFELLSGRDVDQRIFRRWRGCFRSLRRGGAFVPGHIHPPT